MEILNRAGQGRAYVIIFESGQANYQQYAGEVFGLLSQKSKVFLVSIPEISISNWQGITQELLDLLIKNGLRQASILAFGAATAIAQNLALLEPKFVRTLALINPSIRPHPSKLMNFVDRVEAFLPLGLPLRLHSSAFDSKPFLQRLRCPILLTTTSSATVWELENLRIMAERMPTAWNASLHSGSEIASLCSLAIEFEKVPARCPQKNILSAV